MHEWGNHLCSNAFTALFNGVPICHFYSQKAAFSFSQHLQSTVISLMFYMFAVTLIFGKSLWLFKGIKNMNSVLCTFRLLGKGFAGAWLV